MPGPGDCRDYHSMVPSPTDLDPVMQLYDVTIVGGCGRVGLPLGLAFAERGLQVALYDLRADAVESVNAGRMPFVEPGTPEALASVRAAGRLEATLDREAVRNTEHVVVVIGTPIDEHLNPDPEAVPEGQDFTSVLNPASLVVLTGAKVEPSVGNDPAGSRYQFERTGYFISDAVDSKPNGLVFNRTVTLRDSWGKEKAKGGSQP